MSGAGGRQAAADEAGRLIAGGFAGAVAVGTGLLPPPLARLKAPGGTRNALFSATSAVRITELVTVDTGTY